MATKINAAGMKLLRQLAEDPVTPTKDDYRLCSAVQNLINARAIGGWGVEGGWRWEIYEAGWEALGAPPEQRAKRKAEDHVFNLKRRQDIEARIGVPAQGDLFGRAA